MSDVALFPIPGAVSFPGVPRALHVFEPRYRQMIKQCLEDQLPVGVCHTRKLIREGQAAQTREEALNNNQSTYQPEQIFSAGPVELLEELEDGRLLIQVNTDKRLKLCEEKQTLPFSIWRCEEVLDQPVAENKQDALAQTRDKILKRLEVLSHNQADIQATLASDYWRKMAADKFSFAVTGMIGMPGDIAQALLEQTDPQQRLDDILEMINSIRG